MGLCSWLASALRLGPVHQMEYVEGDASALPPCATVLRSPRSMGELVLVTGGAGFIGSHLSDELLRHGYRVRALDSLSPQVHGPERARPAYLDPEVELVVGDVRDPDVVRRALDGVSAVYHFAAAVGVGQSMYEVAH